MNKFNSILAAGLFAAAGVGFAASPASAADSSPSPTAGSQMGQSTGTVHRAANAQHQHTSMSKARVEKVQKALDGNGASIAVDGVWGKKTTAALKQFQTSHGLKATGHLDKATRQQLNLNA